MGKGGGVGEDSGELRRREVLEDDEREKGKKGRADGEDSVVKPWTAFRRTINRDKKVILWHTFFILVMDTGERKEGRAGEEVRVSN